MKLKITIWNRLETINSFLGSVQWNKCSCVQPLCIPWHLTPSYILNYLDLLWFLLRLGVCLLWLRLSRTAVDICVWAPHRHSHWKHLFCTAKFQVKPQCFIWVLAVLFFMCCQWLRVYHNRLGWQFLLNLVFIFPLYLLFILYAF